MTDSIAAVVARLNGIADQIAAAGIAGFGNQIKDEADRLAALGDDTKRLDWLEGVGTVQIAQWYRTGARKFVEIVDQDEQQISEGTTLRAAIDAAMHQEPDEDD